MGRIVALADVLDALLSERPYKPAYSIDESMAMIQEQSGKHFEPALVEALISVLPDVAKINDAFADELGALTDLELN